MKELILSNALFTCVLLLSVWCEVSISESHLEEVASNTGKHSVDTENIATANGQDQGSDVAAEEEGTPQENDPPDKNQNSNNHLNDATHGDHDNPSDKLQSQTDLHESKEVEGHDMDISVEAVTPPPESDITHPPPQPVPTPQTSSGTEPQEELLEPSNIASENQDKSVAKISVPEEHEDVKSIDGSTNIVIDKSQSETTLDNQEDNKPQVAEDLPVTTEAKDPLLSETVPGTDKDTNEQLVADGDKEVPVEVVAAESEDDGVDTDTPKDFKTEPPSGKIDQAAKSKEDDEVEEDINVPINANMMSFEDWKHHKSLSEQLDEKSKEENTQVKDGSKSNKKRQNQASAQCGAKVVAWNPEADNPHNILSENRDLYMINPCKAKKWVVIELCEPVQIDQIELANFELFSSTPDMLNITVSDRYPAKEWKKIGVVHAKDERAIQAFHFNRSSSRVFMMYAKFVKIEMLTYYSNEHFCPMSIVRVFGTAMSDDDFDDDAVAVASDDTAVNKEPENNIIQQAFDKVTDIVNSFVKGSAENNGSVGAKSNENGLQNVSGQQNSSVGEYMLPCVPGVESGDPIDVNNESVTKGDASQTLPQTPILGTASADSKGEIPENMLIRKLEPHEQVSDILSPKTPHPYPPIYSNQPKSHTCDFCQLQSGSTDSCTISRNCFLGFIQNAANKCTHQRFCEPPSIKHHNSADIKKTTQTYEPILIESVGIIEVIDVPVKEEVEVERENGAKLEGEIIKNTGVEDIPESSEVTGSKADVPAGTGSSDSVIYIQPTPTISASDISITETIESSQMENRQTTEQQTTEHIQHTAVPKETTMPKGPEITESNTDAESNEKNSPEAGQALEQQGSEHSVGKIVQKVVDAIEVVDEGEDEGSQQEQQQQVDEPIQKKKESAMMRLHNKVKELERNMSISEQYLEQLSVRYIKQMEEIIKTFNKTITRLSNTSRAAEDRDMKQQMRIQVLESHVDNITETMIGLSEQVKSVSQQVQDKHLLIVVLEVVVMVLLVVLCIMGGRRSSRELIHEQVEPVYTVVTPMKWRRRRHSIDGSIGHSPEKDKVENIGQTSEDATVKASQPQNMLPFFFDDIKAGAAKKKRKRQRKSRSAAVLGELSTMGSCHPPEDIHSDVSSQCSTVSSQESGVHGVTDNRRHSAPLKSAANASNHSANSLNNVGVRPSASSNINVSHLDLTTGQGKCQHLKATKKNSETKFLNKKDGHIKNGVPVLVKQNGALKTNCSKSQHANKSQNSVNHAQKETRTDTKLKENGTAHIPGESERSGSYWFGWSK